MSTTARSQHSGVSQAARPIKTRGQKPKKITAQRNCKGYLSFIISVPGGSPCLNFFAPLRVILDITWRFESIKIGVVFVEILLDDHQNVKVVVTKPYVRKCGSIKAYVIGSAD